MLQQGYEVASRLTPLGMAFMALSWLIAVSVVLLGGPVLRAVIIAT